MTHYNVGSDHSGNGDMDCINRVCDILEQNGHTTTRLGVTPNLEAQLNTGNSDDVGVFIVNGLCLGTIVSCSKMAEAGGCGSVIFGIPKVLYGGTFKLPEELKTKKLNLAHDDNFSPSDVRAMSGKYTPDELFGLYSNVSYAYGDDCDQLANAIMNGTVDGSGSLTPQENEGSIMSGWESITDLLKPLDGDAMVVVRGDSVVIKRIYPPTSTSLWAYEGINIVDDSVKVSDYSPEIYNTFQINWGASFENSFEMCFEKHKELFGERRTEVDATYEVPVEEAQKDPYADEPTTTEESSESNKDDGGIFGFITDSLMNAVTGGAGGVVNSAINAVTLNDESLEGGTEEEEPTTMDIPITDEAEAHLFGLKQVGKAMRKSGHSVECKVIGNKRFEVGEWCRVHIPKFNEDNIMFISKVNHESSSDSEWLTSLTLVDFPPSLGSGQSNTPSTGNMDTGESSEEALMDASLSDTGTDTYDTYGEVV